ncbi:glycine betaine ABC transporter substrate-binding protein [Chromohalobacter canadensis]|uniref:Glycine betaine ABC transporter substrate-binding protein n=1 Tax=Chromohalobacter canadensis TaxID=141389 RepID=A0ABZ0Y6F4_9GAMM|nr:glycine betaine ABC transporter substrate-binding protein [Chromohalobacter canadensis]MCK0769683.1 glycine betaine ABC transporter substrate-binding protein [Chromohalobacter canadensis]MCT8469252.1 glycine betaine ABC transporter substrate-binding protein [Chromohalobacter canadensis]MCT8472558.1 glycine betaine ABC transporter substrate-binding protein [Chromohalobacter canadensis]MCT8500011.1 glycine betaine ABC transporter substrate-binding protein [Chromohalobacter canadensis]WQH07633
MTQPSMRLAGLALIAGAGLAATTAQAQDKGTVNLAYVEWSSTVASTNVMRAVLEQAGYEVELSSLSAAAMWQSVATGDTDALLAGWLPTTHEDYYAQLKDQLVDTGVNLDGTKLGLVVPAYSEVDSIADLNEHADDFDNKLTGIDPGAGIMRLTDKVVEEYDLDLNLQSGSGATMTAALKSAIANDEDIAVTGWTPHWMFARWDLKYLDDPKNVYGGAEQIHTIVRQGLKEDMPEAYAILDAFEWTAEDMGEVMLMNQEEDSDPYENAKQWVEDNQDMVQEWLPES